MKLRNLTRLDALPLLDELRAMAVVEPGPDPKRLARAKKIRSHLQGQEWASLWMREKLDEVYRFLEVLLSARRWRDPPLSIEGMRSEIKGACSRISRLLSGRALNSSDEHFVIS